MSIRSIAGRASLTPERQQAEIREDWPTCEVVLCVDFIAASVTLISSGTWEPVGRVDVGTGACAVGVVPERGEAFVVNSLAGTVSRVSLDPFEVVEELEVGQAPVGLTVAPAHDRIYVTNRGAGTMGVIGVGDGRRWSQIGVGEGPGGVVVDPADGRVYVANAGTGTVDRRGHARGRAAVARARRGAPACRQAAAALHAARLPHR